MKWQGPFIVGGLAAMFLAGPVAAGGEDPAPAMQREIDARVGRIDLKTEEARQERMDALVAYAVREPLAVRLAVEWRLREDWAVACGGDRASVGLVVQDREVGRKVVWAYRLLEDFLEAVR